ncbi:MAG: hypothetical protein I3274_06275 [Candidatus Moeniiplasma glomeromycotorum]|nr:hypothetical protein [Candidatus Moeniiplasma glomeromycotorum]
MGGLDLLLGVAEWFPGIGGASKILSRIIGTAKDALAGRELEKKLSEFSKNLGDCQKGLDEANKKIEAQGKALRGEMEGMKTEMEGALKQQGEKFEEEVKRMDADIAKATGEQKKALEKEAKERKNAMAKQKQELESQIKDATEQLTKAQEEFKKEFDDYKKEIEDKFAEQEHKIKENARRIREEEEARKKEIKEVKDKIKIAEQKTENLRQEHQDFKEKSEQKQNELNRKIEEQSQEFEDFQAETDAKFRTEKAKFEADLEDAKEELENKSREVDAKLKDNQEILTEHEEELSNLQYEQKKQKIVNEELFENIQETNDILFAQQRKLNLVSEQMEDIQEEVHLRMDKLSKDVNQKTQETLNIAKDASKKVDKLTKDVQQMREDLENVEEQIQKNKEETEKLKEQAKQTNQRLDNFFKTQALADFSQEQSNLDKIQKSLELKAEEAKLIATLNLLKETKNIVHLSKDKEWLVGIKQGTENELKGSEGMLLDPNSSWAKKYSKEQLQEWGWDTRLFGEHEKAQLLSEESEKKESKQDQVQAEKQEGEEVQITEAAQQVIEEVNKVQAELLQKLAAIQEEIKTNLSDLESAPPPPLSTPKPSATTALQVISAESKVKIKKKALERQKQAEQEAQQRAASQPTKQNQKQVKEEEKETKKAETEYQQAQEELSSLEKKQEFEEALEEKEKELEENQSEEINLQWQQIQALSVQALQESKDQEKPEETKEEDLKEKLEELVQQLQEQEVAQAASKKTMTYFLLYLIIFLMEYVVYKKNGLPGLIILNIILLICYWYKDKIMEYWDLIGPYLLIIAYVAGNVLAYNSVENPDYKWPMVYGFNAVVGLVYAYTYWERWGAKQKANQIYQQNLDKLREEFKVNTEEWEKIQAQSKKPEPKTWTEKIGRSISESDYNIYSNSTELKIEQLDNFQNFVENRKEAIKKEEEMTKQAEVLQKSKEMEEQLKTNLEKAKEELPSDHPLSNWNKMAPETRTPQQYQVNVPSWLKKWGRERIYEAYPELKNHPVNLELLDGYQKTDNLIKDIEEKQEKGITARKTLLDRLNKIPLPSEEEKKLFSYLELTLEQYIAISLKTPYLTPEEMEWITNNYLSLTSQAKLQLLNAGLNALEINTYEKKEKLAQILITLQNERELFGLTNKEKESVLRFMMNTLDLSDEQQEKLENMGVKPYNATEWEITEEQKNSILDFGLNKLILTEEQKGKLVKTHPDTFKTFALNPEQKNILTSLAPLIREDKYSEESLDLFYQEIKENEDKKIRIKPWFKYTTLIFLVQEEIIPELQTSFGVVKNNYLPLKEKFLKGEWIILRKMKEAEEKEIREQEIQENKLSILGSLLTFANKNKSEEDYILFRLNYPLIGEIFTYQEKEINRNLLNEEDRKILAELETEKIKEGKEEIIIKKTHIFTQLVRQEKKTLSWVSVGALNL